MQRAYQVGRRESLEGRIVAGIATKLLLVQLLFAGQVKSFYSNGWILSDEGCGTADADTCSPSRCEMGTNSACNVTASTVDVKSGISDIACQTCTQSSHAWCSTSFLQSTFQGHVLAAYCNDDFLVIHSNGLADHPDSLAKGNPHPPGEGGGVSYADGCVTRSYDYQFLSFKVPLNGQALPAASNKNNLDDMKGPTARVSMQDILTNVSLPKSGPVAAAINGLPIFPPYNDGTHLTWEQCEVDKCNAHAGQNFDYHYHGDPFGEGCLYSGRNYSQTDMHPPIIGFTLDGFQLHGRYLNDSAPGIDDPIDDCGGHDHGSYSYHYHSFIRNFTVTDSGNQIDVGVSYNGSIAGPYKCWRGNISKIENFWDLTESAGKRTAAYGSGRFSPSNVDERTDYENLKPCCASTKYLVADGVTLDEMTTSSPTLPPTTLGPSLVPTTAVPSFSPTTSSPTTTEAPTSKSASPTSLPSASKVVESDDGDDDSDPTVAIVVVVVVVFGLVAVAVGLWNFVYKPWMNKQALAATDEGSPDEPDSNRMVSKGATEAHKDL